MLETIQKLKLIDDRKLYKLNLIDDQLFLTIKEFKEFPNDLTSSNDASKIERS